MVILDKNINTNNDTFCLTVFYLQIKCINLYILYHL